MMVFFLEGRARDSSSVEAILGSADRDHAVSKQLPLRHRSPECRTLSCNAQDVVDVDRIEDSLCTLAWT